MDWVSPITLFPYLLLYLRFRNPLQRKVCPTQQVVRNTNPPEELEPQFKVITQLLSLTWKLIIAAAGQGASVIFLELGYRNRYNLIDRPSGSLNFCEINKGLWFWHNWNIFYQFTKPFIKFELLPGAAQW